MFLFRVSMSSRSSSVVNLFGVLLCSKHLGVNSY